MDYETIRVDLVSAGVRAGTVDDFVSAVRDTEALRLAILRAAQRGERVLREERFSYCDLLPAG